MTGTVLPDHVVAIHALGDDVIGDGLMDAVLHRVAAALATARAPIASPWSLHHRDGPGRIEFARALRPAAAVSVVHMRHTQGPDQSVGLGVHRPGRSTIVTLTAPVGLDLSAVSPTRRGGPMRRAEERGRATALLDLLVALTARAIADMADPGPGRDADVEVLEAPAPWGAGSLRVRPLGREGSRVALDPAPAGTPTLLEARLSEGSVELECAFGALRRDLPSDPVAILDAMRAAAALGRAAAGAADPDS